MQLQQECINGAAWPKEFLTAQSNPSTMILACLFAFNVTDCFPPQILSLSFAQLLIAIVHPFPSATLQHFQARVDHSNTGGSHPAKCPAQPEPGAHSDHSPAVRAATAKLSTLQACPPSLTVNQHHHRSPQLHLLHFIKDSRMIAVKTQISVERSQPILPMGRKATSPAERITDLGSLLSVPKHVTRKENSSPVPLCGTCLVSTQAAPRAALPMHTEGISAARGSDVIAIVQRGA